MPLDDSFLSMVYSASGDKLTLHSVLTEELIKESSNLSKPIVCEEGELCTIS